MKPIRLIAGFLTVGVWTMASRILGFVRDILLAALLGAGPVAEAFLVAFSLPNMFRRFFAEGAFNMAFVPMFSRKLEGDVDAQDFARDAMSALAAVLIAVTLIAMAGMPWLVLAMAGGFADDARFGMAIVFGRIAFVYILFISLAALCSGVLNALGRFAAAAAAPVLLNVILITVLLLFAGDLGDALAPDGQPGEGTGLALSWGVVLAGIAQLALVWVAASRAGIRLIPRLPRLTPEVRRLAVIAAPAALAGGVVQINLLVGRQVASFFDGAIVWLSIADRLYQLPLGVIGIAIGIVLLPDLSRRLAAGDDSGGREAFNRATEICLGLTLPAAVALMVIPTPLVSVLFERAAFTAADTQATAAALIVYGAGLPAFVLQKCLQPLYFAREDTRSPFRFALWSMVINATVAVGLASTLGFLAAAWGTTLAGWGMVWLLWRGAARMGMAARLDDRLKRALPRIALSVMFMGAVLTAVQWGLGDLLGHSVWRYAALTVLVGAGLGSYGVAVLATGALSRADLARSLKRSRN